MQVALILVWTLWAGLTGSAKGDSNKYLYHGKESSAPVIEYTGDNPDIILAPSSKPRILEFYSPLCVRECE